MKRRWWEYWPYLPLGLWALIVLFPLYWLVITSFKPALAVSQGPKYLPWIDFQPTAEPWRGILLGPQAESIRSALANSLVVGLVSSLFSLLTGSLAAYGLSRFRYRAGRWGNQDILLFMVSQRMTPPIVTVLALFLMLRVVGLLDSRLGLILVYTAFNLPLAVWLMYHFFQQVPPHLEEAARVDGASQYQILWRIVLPVALPGLVASFLLILIFAWNEFLFALILTFNKARTLPILIAAQHSQRGVEWWTLSAMSVLTIAPVVLITLALNRFLVERLLSGSQK